METCNFVSSAVTVGRWSFPSVPRFILEFAGSSVVVLVPFPLLAGCASMCSLAVCVANVMTRRQASLQVFPPLRSEKSLLLQCLLFPLSWIVALMLPVSSCWRWWTGAGLPAMDAAPWGVLLVPSFSLACFFVARHFLLLPSLFQRGLCGSRLRFPSIPTCRIG